MKMIKNLGFVFLASAMVMPLFAFHSTITDSNAGNATDVVETNNIIHVYNFTGASSEAAQSVSTFDEGEDWVNFTWTPTFAPSQHTAQKVPTGLMNKDYKSPYVQAIDNCLDAGNRWNHRTNICE